MFWKFGSVGVCGALSLLAQVPAPQVESTWGILLQVALKIPELVVLGLLIYWLMNSQKENNEIRERSIAETNKSRDDHSARNREHVEKLTELWLNTLAAQDTKATIAAEMNGKLLTQHHAKDLDNHRELVEYLIELKAAKKS